MWDRGGAYGRFMGRWSGPVAEAFLEHVPVPARASWLDVGCGTGELLGAILRTREPARAVGIDPSDALVAAAERRWQGLAEVAEFAVGSAERLPYPAASFDGVVAGLALNFVPEPEAALAEMARVARPGATVGLYVWDYDHPDFFLTRFWSAVEHVLGRRAAGDERSRWPVCTEAGLARVVRRRSGLADVTTFPLVTSTVFEDTADLWDSFGLGVGPAGGVLDALDDDQRQAVRATLEEGLPGGADDQVHLSARAWAVTATSLG